VGLVGVTGIMKGCDNVPLILLQLDTFSVCCRCKLFCKADDSWKDRGTGYLFLKPCGDCTQLLIRADTATG